MPGNKLVPFIVKSDIFSARGTTRNASRHQCMALVYFIIVIVQPMTKATDDNRSEVPGTRRGLTRRLPGPLDLP